MINRCIGCYYHDNKENVCTHGSPIFIDDECTDYQYSEFVIQIRVDAIEDCISIVDGYLIDIPVKHDNVINELCKLKKQKQ